jgi:TonB-dependent receptor
MNLIKKKNYKLIKSLFILLTFNLGYLNAGTIKGRVIDSYTHETVIGAAVFLDRESNYVISGTSGQYAFINIKPGTYIINAKSAGYENSVLQQLIVKTNADTLSYDIYLKPKTTAIDEVKVIGNINKETDMSARNDERLASNVINIVSAKTIESLPDQNVADVMQRISGVSMAKNSFGSNSNVIIRGMPTRYNSVLVDGTVMPSTSSSGRSVSLDMFGSELVGRIEVIKGMRPDLEGDAIGGTVNIIMKQAPDTAFFKVQAGSGYNQYYFDHSFLTFDNSTVAAKDFNALYGPTFLADASLFPRQNLIVKTERAIPDLNLSLSGGRRFFNKKLGIMVAGSIQNTSLANTYNAAFYSVDPLTNKSDVDYWESQIYNKIQMRYGGYGKIDYQFNRNNQISLYSSFFQVNELRVREYTDRDNGNGAVNYRPIETQTETDNSGISCTTLKGEHKVLNNLDIDWIILYAVANSTSPDFAQIEEAKLGNQPPTLNYTQPVNRDWQWDIDQNKSAYLNINYKPDIFGHLFEFKAGGMFRDKYRRNYNNQYFFDGPKNPINYPYPNLLTVPLTNNQNNQQKEGNAIFNINNYWAWEDIGAYYGMVTTSFGKLQVLAGLRTESTYIRTDQLQIKVGKPHVRDTVKNIDPLPSLHLTYKLTENQNLRFSVYKAINRQDYTELIKTDDQRAGSSSGNPFLKRAIANCYDFRYEIYPQNEEVLSAGVFYKNINQAILELVNINDSKTFGNVAECTDYGLELVAVKYFGNFGINANYTYTHSEIPAIPKHFFVIKNGVYDTTIIRYQKTPFVGQSPHVINISMSYRTRWGFRTSIVYTMQGYHLVSNNDAYNKDTYMANYHDLGLTIDQKIGKRWIIMAKVSNLLNSPIDEYIQDDGSNVLKKYNYTSYFIGLKFNL